MARQAFSARGYDGVNLRDLARDAEVTTGRFYANWPGGKAALFEEAMGRPPPDIPAFLSRVEAQCRALPAHLGELSDEAGVIRRLSYGGGE